MPRGLAIKRQIGEKISQQSQHNCKMVVMVEVSVKEDTSQHQNIH